MSYLWRTVLRMTRTPLGRAALGGAVILIAVVLTAVARLVWDFAGRGMGWL